MGYANQFIGGGDGREAARRLAAAGAAGVIVADLTPDEGGPFEAVAREHGLAVVYLVAPTTPPERRAEIAARSGGFLYCVSLVGVTGARDSLPSTVGRLVRDVVAASPVPVGVGFGVSRPAHVRALAKAGAGGVIVASALVDALGDGRPGRRPDGRARPGPRRPRPGAAREGRRRDRGRPEEGVRDRRRLARLEPLGQDRGRGGRVADRVRRALCADRQGRRRGVRSGQGRRRRRRAPVGRRRDRLRRAGPGHGAGSATRDGLRRDAARRPGRGLLEGVRPDLGGRARGAPKGSARRRPRHVEDRRPRARLRAGLRERHGDQAQGVPDERPRRSSTTSAPRCSRSSRAPSDGDVLAGKRWTTRYAAHRIAWHALDHAWEIEDRSEPAG